MPNTEWVAPTEFPDLRSADEIAIDLETRDPNLKKIGSGSIIGVGEVVGIAVAVNGYKRYFPIAHEVGPNQDRKKVLKWFKEICESPSTKIFHNAMYDVCWIRNLGIKIKGRIIDTMIASSLIDENRYNYTLNTLSWVYLKQGKNETLLNQAAKERELDPKADMWRLPAMVVGDYAERDAELTLMLWQHLKKIIIEDDLQSIFNLETDLFPCLVDMRFLGVKVDVEKANQLKKQLTIKEELLIHQIKKQTGIDIQIWAARSIAEVFDKLKLSYNITEKTGAPSFTKNFISKYDHPIVNMIAEARKINKISTTFIDSILSYQNNGRIHADINQIRSDDGGTVTGRFSYANPNLQQIPAKDPNTGPLIRSLFIPEDNCKWGVFDYSQQEPRLVAHYALKFKFNSAQIITNLYKNDPSTDFHQMVADMANIKRKEAKTINLGLFYGMGKSKLQEELNVTKEKAAELFNIYHDKVPFVKELMNEIMEKAQKNGKIKTILNRKCRFPKYEPVLKGSDWGTFVPAEDHERMLELQKMGPHLLDDNGEVIYDSGGSPKKNYWHKNGCRRAMTYKALNKLIQGSAADMTKKAMLDLYNEKIIAHIQIHDELDISIIDENQAKKIIQIMEQAVKLEIPNKVDYKCGDNWGEINK